MGPHLPVSVPCLPLHFYITEHGMQQRPLVKEVSVYIDEREKGGITSRNLGRKGTQCKAVA